MRILSHFLTLFSCIVINDTSKGLVTNYGEGGGLQNGRGGT